MANFTGSMAYYTVLLHFTLALLFLRFLLGKHVKCFGIRLETMILGI